MKRKSQRMEHAMMCPQCNAPLTPHRFAQSVVCAYCGATVRFGEQSISAEKFHEAFRIWNNPLSYQLSSWISIGDHHWALDKFLAHGESADVYTGRRARWPTELVILKILRESQNVDRFDNEWNALQTLHKSGAPGAETYVKLLPQPVMHGDSTGGSHTGQRVNIYRHASGFRHTFNDVLQAYPQGIPPRASIWVWRRILEVLSFIHASGMAHGAVLPEHLLIQDNEHGVRLVGYSSAGRLGKKLTSLSKDNEPFFPKESQLKSGLSSQLDIVMSARCVIALLGGNPADASLPSPVPKKLAEFIQRIALSKTGDIDSQNAWAIRGKLGNLADEIFGPRSSSQ